MAKDRLPVGKEGQTAAPMGGAAPAGPGTARPAIVIVERGPGEYETLYQELSKRHGVDYRIVGCDKPAEAGALVGDLLAAGTPVALVIGGVGAADPAGLEVLAAIRGIDPTVLRVAAVRWGEWETARPIFDAITTGTIDHWVTRPVQSPDEEFHHSVT
jgi:hypothetical protein